MKTKEQIANELNISRKSLYNYMNELNIKNLTEENIKIINDYITPLFLCLVFSNYD